MHSLFVSSATYLLMMLLSLPLYYYRTLVSTLSQPIVDIDFLTWPMLANHGWSCSMVLWNYVLYKYWSSISLDPFLMLPLFIFLQHLLPSKRGQINKISDTSSLMQESYNWSILCHLAQYFMHCSYFFCPTQVAGIFIFTI